MNLVTTIDLHFQDVEQAIAAFLIESEAGPILVECGPHSTLQHLEKGLAKKGYELDDVKHVFITHIHLDHAGCAWCLAQRGAKIYVHPRGYKHLLSPQRLLASASMIYRDQMDLLWGQMHAIAEEQLVAAQDQQVIKVGELSIKPHFTPGHAVHHIAWQIDQTLFSGDVAGVKIGSGPIMPPCPPPDINLEDWIASIAHIGKLDLDAIYLTHFGKITDITNHLEALEHILKDWARWMKPHYDANEELTSITPLFQQYVTRQLQVAHVEGPDLLRYEHANPAWMSVAGLMRYWKIKARTEQGAP